MSRPSPAVGIDLGTTNSAVAFLDASGRPETIRNAEGGLTTPSVVFFDRSRPIVGSEALEAGHDEPERMAQFAKRDVGEQLFRNPIVGHTFPPEVLQALVLGKLKSDAELRLGEIDKAIITVPAFFNEPCRKATQDAGRLAGLEVLDIINEPTAAAICFGVQQGFLTADGSSRQREQVLVYDLGGGTFDVTLMEIEGRDYRTIATSGDVYLGGIDWDRRIVDHLAEIWMAEHGSDPRQDGMAEQDLLRKAIQAKHALSQRDSVAIPFSHEGLRIRPELDRRKLEELTEDLVERTMMTVELVLDEASLQWSDLSRLILVGGSTRMPMIRDEMSRRSGLELDRSLSPDEAVAHGAAIYAGIRLGHDCDSFAGISISNVNSHDLGVLAKDPETGQPRRKIMIPKNTSLPASQCVRFRTHEAAQQNVKVEIVEGGDDRGNNATKIGKCLVDDLPKDLPKGTFVDVRFDYSQDGRLTVAADLPSFQRAAKMTLNRAAGMSDEVFQQWKRQIEEGIVVEPKEPESPSLDSQSQHSPSQDSQTRKQTGQAVPTPMGTESRSSKSDPTPQVSSPTDHQAIAEIQIDSGASVPVPDQPAGMELQEFLGSLGLNDSRESTPPVTDLPNIEIETTPAANRQQGKRKLRRVSGSAARPKSAQPESDAAKPKPIKKLVRKSSTSKAEQQASDRNSRQKRHVDPEQQ